MRLRILSTSALLVTTAVIATSACSSEYTGPGETIYGAGRTSLSAAGVAGKASGGSEGTISGGAGGTSGGVSGTVGVSGQFSAGTAGEPSFTSSGAGGSGTAGSAGRAGSSAAQSGAGSSSGGSSSSSAGSSGNGAAGAPPPPPPQCEPPTDGETGFTTRFWDCCKPSCGWSQNSGGRPVRTCNQQNGGTGADTASACSGGGGFACYDFSPWAVSDTLAYGFAAFNRGGCGTCYELSFTGESNSQPDDLGSKMLCGKKMIVMVVNIGGIQGNQFDIMIPGGGVGDFDACSRQWNAAGNLGERYGGLQLKCQKEGSNDFEARKTCTQNACNTLFSRSELGTLKAGCNWSVDWLQAADNPKIRFKQVNCPQELNQKAGR